jgi:hypothetical protein
MVNILTFILSKDQTTYNNEGYASVLNQQNVNQDIYVISAEPIPCINNFVVKVSESYPVSIRVAISINEALRYYWSPKYDYFFKVDSDIILDPNYLIIQIEKNIPLIGLGWTLLIKNKVFSQVFQSRWFVSYCDDFCMIAKAFSYGLITSLNENEGHHRSANANAPIIDKKRRYYVGHEFRKIGFPFWYMLSTFILNIFIGNITTEIYDLSGYIHAFNIRKYDFAKYCQSQLIRNYLSKSYIKKELIRIKEIIRKKY